MIKRQNVIVSRKNNQQSRIRENESPEETGGNTSTQVDKTDVGFQSSLGFEFRFDGLFFPCCCFSGRIAFVFPFFFFFLVSDSSIIICTNNTKKVQRLACHLQGPNALKKNLSFPSSPVNASFRLCQRRKEKKKKMFLPPFNGVPGSSLLSTSHSRSRAPAAVPVRQLF